VVVRYQYRQPGQGLRPGGQRLWRVNRAATHLTGSVMVKVVPTPGRLTISSRPCISVTSSWQMTSPSPEPVCWRPWRAWA
jgi:hypothetical protein